MGRQTGRTVAARFFCVSTSCILMRVLTMRREWVQNELGILEFIHALVETMDKYFESVVRLSCGRILRSYALHD